MQDLVIRMGGPLAPAHHRLRRQARCWAVCGLVQHRSCLPITVLLVSVTVSWLV